MPTNLTEEVAWYQNVSKIWIINPESCQNVNKIWIINPDRYQNVSKIRILHPDSQVILRSDLDSYFLIKGFLSKIMHFYFVGFLLDFEIMFPEAWWKSKDHCNVKLSFMLCTWKAVYDFALHMFVNIPGMLHCFMLHRGFVGWRVRYIQLYFWPLRLWRLLEAKKIISRGTLWHFNSTFGSSLSASSAYQRFTKTFLSVMTFSLHISNSRTKPTRLDFYII